MTSVINESENLFPPAPPSAEETTNELQLIHPDLIEENIPQAPTPDIPTLVPECDTPVEAENIIPGQFDYIKDSWQREMLVNAWQAINVTETWDFVKQDIESFMWSNDPRIWTITRKMEELGYRGHSGSSFGCTMRTMQYIANHGEKKFKEEHLTRNQ
jgi:hypothetical protein